MQRDSLVRGRGCPPGRVRATARRHNNGSAPSSPAAADPAPTRTAGAGSVHSLLVAPDGAGSALYVAGYFNRVGPTLSSELVAKWNGTSWSGFGGPPECPPLVSTAPAAYALASYDSGDGPELHVAGSFYSLAGVAARNIARWSNEGWVPLDAGMGRWISGTLAPSMVNELVVFDGGEGPELVAAGLFNRAGPTDAPMNSSPPAVTSGPP